MTETSAFNYFTYLVYLLSNEINFHQCVLSNQVLWSGKFEGDQNSTFYQVLFSLSRIACLVFVY